jgi:hypothetical protein
MNLKSPIILMGLFLCPRYCSAENQFSLSLFQHAFHNPISIILRDNCQLAESVILVYV